MTPGYSRKQPLVSKRSAAAQLLCSRLIDETKRQEEQFRDSKGVPDHDDGDRVVLPTSDDWPVGEFRWLRNRLIYWPNEVDCRTRIGLVSSRLGRRLDLKTHWFGALRTTVTRLDRKREVVVTVEGTAAFEATVRSCDLFGLDQIRVHVMSEGDITEQAAACHIERLVVEVHDHAAVPVESSTQSAFLSAPLFPLHNGVELQTGEGHPERDSALVDISDRIVCLECRPRGNIESLISARLRCDAEDAVNTPAVVLVSMSGSSPATSSALMIAGAIPWYLKGDGSVSSSKENCRPRPSMESLSVGKSLIDRGSGPLDAPDEWLHHWTRPTPGSWQEQPHEEYLDELILGCRTADRSALATLMRILSEQRLRASVVLAGSFPTVSFTSTPLCEFRENRVYRRHRRRYDFEPWGVSIRRTVLERCGARPVQYVNANDVLPRDSKSDGATEGQAGECRSDVGGYAQRRYDRSGRIDWSREREWRVQGGIDLSCIEHCDLCVFVDSDDEAEQIRAEFGVAAVVVPEG